MKDIIVKYGDDYWNYGFRVFKINELEEEWGFLVLRLYDYKENEEIVYSLYACSLEDKPVNANPSLYIHYNDYFIPITIDMSSKLPDDLYFEIPNAKTPKSIIRDNLELLIKHWHNQISDDVLIMNLKW